MEQTYGPDRQKANSTLGFLRRNLRFSNEEKKSAAYFSMVRSILEYSSTIWSPYTKDYIHKIEMVQRRAARYVTNRYRNIYSVTSMIEHLEWKSLEARRATHQLTMLFRSCMTLWTYLTPASNRTRSQHSLKFRQIATSSDNNKFSFFPRSFCHWNSLPANVAEAPSLVSFKRELPLYPFRLLGPAILVALMRFLSCVGGDFVCPGAATGSQIGLGTEE